MFLVLWEFEVKPGCERRFESVYGPAGDWAQLFHRDPHYPGTRLLCDVSLPQMYVTVDVWQSQQAYELFKSQNLEAYAALDKTCRDLTVSERFLGSFDQAAEPH
jgi:hypothetical protein